MKNIKDFLHLYLGCECRYENETFTLAGVYNQSIVYSTDADESGEGTYGIEDCKPILRPLSDMTEKEKRDVAEIVFVDSVEIPTNSNEIKYYATPKRVLYLLSKHFDLFNLIPEGLAIDKTKIPIEQ